MALLLTSTQPFFYSHVNNDFTHIFKEFWSFWPNISVEFRYFGPDFFRVTFLQSRQTFLPRCGWVTALPSVKHVIFGDYNSWSSHNLTKIDHTEYNSLLYLFPCCIYFLSERHAMIRIAMISFKPFSWLNRNRRGTFIFRYNQLLNILVPCGITREAQINHNPWSTPQSHIRDHCMLCHELTRRLAWWECRYIYIPNQYWSWSSLHPGINNHQTSTLINHFIISTK